MNVSVVCIPCCKQCDVVKRILKKNNIVFDVFEHGVPVFDVYPVVYVDGEMYAYLDFLRFVKGGGLKDGN